LIRGGYKAVCLKHLKCQISGACINDTASFLSADAFRKIANYLQKKYSLAMKSKFIFLLAVGVVIFCGSVVSADISFTDKLTSWANSDWLERSYSYPYLTIGWAAIGWAVVLLLNCSLLKGRRIEPLGALAILLAWMPMVMFWRWKSTHFFGNDEVSHFTVVILALVFSLISMFRISRSPQPYRGVYFVYSGYLVALSHVAAGIVLFSGLLFIPSTISQLLALGFWIPCAFVPVILFLRPARPLRLVTIATIVTAGVFYGIYKSIDAHNQYSHQKVREKESVLIEKVRDSINKQISEGSSNSIQAKICGDRAHLIAHTQTIIHHFAFAKPQGSEEFAQTKYWMSDLGGTPLEKSKADMQFDGCGLPIED
jgi:hypothetical protein